MNSKKKVFIFTSDYRYGVGGIAKNTQTLQFYLKKIGYTVSVMTGRSHFFMLLPAFVRQIYLSLNWQFLSLFYSWNSDFINIHTGAGGILFYPFFTKAKIFYTCHHTYHQQITHLRQWYKYPFFLVEKMLYHFADKIIAVSESTKNVLIEQYHIPDLKIEILSNFCDPEAYSSASFLKRKEKDILFIGRLDKRKNPGFMLYLLQSLVKSGQFYHLHFVGIGPLLTELSNFASENSLSSHVTFHGKVNEQEKLTLMKTCKYLVVPSLFEGQGIVCLEAAHAGICFLANNVDGLRDVTPSSCLFSNLAELKKMILYFSSHSSDYDRIVADNKVTLMTEQEFILQLNHLFS